ncbi:MAG: Tn3 family transposase [Chloroflexi bacterium]|nr:Tn3 family transposase [Chloroflexota bacterium]
MNAIMVWNTRYMGHALHDLRNAGMPINPEDVERLSPLLHYHVHLDGRYTLRTARSGGARRAKADP